MGIRVPKLFDANRCPWAGTDPVYVAYHDEEWGVPVFDDRKLFEFLVLEGAQAGLSWITILARREGYREAFAGFDPERVARFDRRKVASLLKNPRIIRNRLKVQSAVSNAKAFLRVQGEFGGFSPYQWGFVKNCPVVNRWKTMKQLPAHTPLSDAFSADLARRGFSFVGSTIVYAHMQAVGMVNDHLVTCLRHPRNSNVSGVLPCFPSGLPEAQAAPGRSRYRSSGPSGCPR